MSGWSIVPCAVFAITALASPVLGQQFFAIDAEGGLWEGDLGSPSVSLNGVEESIGLFRCLQFLSDGRLAYLAQGVSGKLFEVDPDTGEASLIFDPQDEIEDYVTGVAMTSDGLGTLFLVYYTLDSLRLAQFDEATLQLVADIQVQRDATGYRPIFSSIIVREDGMLLGVASSLDHDVIVATIHPEGGAVEILSITERDYSGSVAITRQRGTYVLFVSDNGSLSIFPDHLHVWLLDPETGVGVPTAMYTFPNPIAGATLVPENPADRALPYGDLDVSDAVSFLRSFADSEPEADLAEPYGVHDYDDVVGFIRAFQRGYP